MKVLNFSPIATVTSCLTDRCQYVQIEHVESEIHLVGSQSVTQGSTLSCLLFLIYILNIPQIFHDRQHGPLEYRRCTAPGIEMFVNDNYVKIVRTDKSLEQHVTDTVNRIKTYMDANKMTLNPDKSQVLVVTKDMNLVQKFQIQMDGKTIKHSPMVKISGITLDENLIPNMKNSIQTLKLTTKFMTEIQKRIHKCYFQRQTVIWYRNWGGGGGVKTSTIQSLQDKETKIALHGEKDIDRKSNKQRHAMLKWQSIQREVELATHKITNKISRSTESYQQNQKS